MVLLLVALLAFTQDVFVPPVPRGIGRDDVKIRKVKQPIPFPRAGQPWIRVRTARFDVISSAAEPRTRAIARDLESLAAALTEASPRFEKARVPTTVFVFKDRRESQPYFDLIFEGGSVAGMYVRHAGGAAMFIDASRRGFERTAMHELVHDLLRQREALPPHWLEEGLAEYVANAQITSRGVIAGLPIKQHVNLLAATPARTVADMIAVKNETAESASSYFYAQSWAAVHWLMQTDAVAFWPFLRDLETGTPLAVALRTHYGKTPDDLHRGIHHNARDNTQVRLAATAPAVTTEARVMDRPTLLYELGWFLYWVPGAGRESERLFREALRLDPKHARTLAAQGKYEAAIAADPNDPDIHLRYAESQLELAIGPFAGTFQPTDSKRFRKARELAVRALNLGGDEARARGALGVSYLVEDDLAPGITALEQARALAPRRMDYAIQLYSMYLRTGARAKADALFAEAFVNAPEQVAFAARKVLLDFETERANTLALEGKLAEAAAVVRSLAATITEPLARADMERQADQMEALAVVNSHIRMYNEAVRHSNKGMKKDALKVLDELLAVATDAQVVRDAEKLRKELRDGK